jgi:hypothetical protein
MISVWFPFERKNKKINKSGKREGNTQEEGNEHLRNEGKLKTLN